MCRLLHASRHVAGHCVLTTLSQGLEPGRNGRFVKTWLSGQAMSQCLSGYRLRSKIFQGGIAVPSVRCGAPAFRHTVRRPRDTFGAKPWSPVSRSMSPRADACIWGLGQPLALPSPTSWRCVGPDHGRGCLPAAPRASSLPRPRLRKGRFSACPWEPSHRTSPRNLVLPSLNHRNCISGKRGILVSDAVDVRDLR